MSIPVRAAIITGGGSGIGKRTALALLVEGYSVAIAGRRAERLEETVAEAGDASSRTLAVPTDVTDPAAIRNLFAKTVETFGRLDLPLQQCRRGRTGRSHGGTHSRTVANSCRHKLDRFLPVHAGSD